ncbi:hypothetical protein Chor_015504, partial [Crotalus horridus]
EDKENANKSIWNEVDSILENTFISPKNLNSHVLKQIKTDTNCNSPNSMTVADPESAAVKSKVMSFTQTFLQKANINKQRKADVPSSVPCISEKHILGSYRGKIVSSKVNSFRKVPANESRNYLPALPKSRVKLATTNNAKVAGNAGAPKVPNSTPFQTSTVRVSVYHPKTILNHEKQSVSGSTENHGTTQKNCCSNRKPLLKTVPTNANNSVQRTKKLAPSKTVSGSLKVPAFESRATMSPSKSTKKAPTSVDVRRLQLAEWQASKGTKKQHNTIAANSQPKKATSQQTTKEPAESFWATIVEEDEQGLLSDKVNKTLAECLDLIEKGSVGEKVHSILENLIMKVPDAKKFAKYWVCQMRLEQFRSTEKVITIYEKAILAGAQLRHTLADVIKTRRDLPKTDECVKEENIVNPEGPAETEIEEAFKEVSLKNKMEHSNETFQESTEICSKIKEDLPKKKKNKNKEQMQKPIDLKNEETDTNAEKERLQEIQTPENEKGAYLIKYNLSTTSHLESTKKRLQCDDSTIKNLKFLTPVRRSCRIHEKANKLPSMLKEHSPCVSSLQQLGELGDEGTGFIYRPNNALTISQQDQSRE